MLLGMFCLIIIFLGFLIKPTNLSQGIGKRKLQLVVEMGSYCLFLGIPARGTSVLDWKHL